jgi:hypothetical protein
MGEVRCGVFGLSGLDCFLDSFFVDVVSFVVVRLGTYGDMWILPQKNKAAFPQQKGESAGRLLST